MRGGVSLQKLSIVREAGLAAGFDKIESVSQGHLPVEVVVPVGFAVRGDMDQLRPAAGLGKRSQEAAGELFSVGQEFFKGDAPRDGAVVEKQVYGQTRGQGKAVSAGRIDLFAAHVQPVAAVNLSDLMGLAWSQDREADPLLGDDFEGLQVDGGLGEPQPFRMPAEAADEIPDPPDDLSLLVPPVGQGKDHMIVGLGQGRAVAGEKLLALPVRRQDGLVGLRGIFLQPRQEGGAEIEADPGVIVDHPGNAPVSVQDPGGAVGSVALLGDSFIPIMERVGGILELDGLQPGILPRRLVEMPMNGNITLQ